MFTEIIEFILFIGIGATIYYTFVSDWWGARHARFKESKILSSNIGKIAQVKLVSDDKKDIEQFITENATYLTDQMVDKLVARIESLKVDDVIINDDRLKKRIVGLPIQEEEEENAKTTRSQRINN